VVGSVVWLQPHHRTNQRDFSYLLFYFHPPLKKTALYLITSGIGSVFQSWGPLMQSGRTFFNSFHTGLVNFISKIPHSKFDVVLAVHRQYYVKTKCQLDATDEFLLQIFLLAQHVSGTFMPIIRSSGVLYK
jgi:hypothetical protein